MSGARKAWIVAASIGAIEALKDQGVCRWNYVFRSLQQHAKTNLGSYYQAQRLSSSSSSAIATKMKAERAKRMEEKRKKVMDLDCWGPSTIRF
ncbi:hypothetical protein LOK49_LG03G00526 [Camellia lanceoleosa]|uniref:Uncharacterized protein n=1 Tax=Camellia lanceoleosa TaxID=1840588 RepID=A0ACC0I802_9ERIC|nr:hypothetical protein LOK49_LG03G00526 [Camellia lanceoleosa]